MTSLTSKKKKSYLRRIPSKDFTPDVYDLFLIYATVEELEEDFITRETFQKIIMDDWD